MAIKNVVLLADGAELTVGRQAATIFYGALDIDWECTGGLDDGAPEQLPGVVSENMQQGYYYSSVCPWVGPLSVYDVGFSRCDINTKIKYSVGDEIPGEFYKHVKVEDWDNTPLPRIFARQTERVAGGIFFDHEFSESEILGGSPGVDFNVGDVVNVLLWGRTWLQLPVAQLTVVSDESSLRRWRIQLGARAIRDAEALREQNEKVWQAIAQERLRSDQLYARRA